MPGVLRASIAVLLLASANLAEGQVPPPTEERQYSGCYFSGFEVSSFNPREVAEKGWWSHWIGDRTLLDQVLPSQRSRRESGAAFVVLRGRVSVKGNYGHGGGSEREIYVTRIVSARKPLPEDGCGSPVAAPGPGENPQSTYEYGARMEREGKFPDAVRAYRRAARAGDGKAAKRLGEIYDKGAPGIGRDYAESLQWFEKAKQLGAR